MIVEIVKKLILILYFSISLMENPILGYDISVNTSCFNISFYYLIFYNKVYPISSGYEKVESPRLSNTFIFDFILHFACLAYINTQPIRSLCLLLTTLFVFILKSYGVCTVKTSRKIKALNFAS